MTRPTHVTLYWYDEYEMDWNLQVCVGFKEIREFVKMNKGQKFYIEVD